MSQKYFNFNCRSLEDLDLFSKAPELYYKGKSQKSALIGRIFTVLYAIIYAAFFIYKIIRMYLKIDVSFYETETFTGEIPSLKLNNDLFYGGFALVDSTTQKTFIDETVYYPIAIFRSGKKIDGNWIWEDRILGTEQCRLEKFGSKFRGIFSDKIEDLYCLTDVDVTIQGHTTYDVYSFFYVEFYPCVEGNLHGRTGCKNITEIRNKIGNTMLTVKMQDIELTPQIYKTPIQLRSRELSAPVMENLYNNINAYFHIVSIETDNDVLGFEALSKVDIKRYFKYDVTFMVNSVNDVSPLTSGKPYCNILLQLTEQMITIDRTYTKLVEVLGDVGGLMEFVFSFLKILSLFITDAYYDKGMVNNLFSFDIDKKIITIKNLKKDKKEIYSNEIPGIEPPDIFTPIKPSRKFISQISIDKDETIHTKNLLNNNLNKNNLENENVLVHDKTKIIKKRKIKKLKRKTSVSTKNGPNNEENQIPSPNDKIMKNDTKINFENKTQREENEKDNRHIVDKIKFNKIDIYLCFICIRKRKNYQNFLLDEGMNLISKYLDILYLFIKMHQQEKIFQKHKNEDIIEMSDECKNNLQTVNQSFYPK